MTFFAIFSKVFSKLKLLIFFKNLKFLTLYLGTVRVLSKIANLALKHDCSNPCSFRDMFFLIFSKSFLKTYMIFLKLIFKIWNSQPCSWVLSDYSEELKILPTNMIVQILVVFEIWRFLLFFSKSFLKTYMIFFRKIWNSQPWSWVLSEKSQRLRILPPNMTVQIIVVFEMWRFLWFFQKFSVNLNYY